MNALELLDVHYSYPGCADVIQSLTLKSADREFIALMGPSGSGKTTLLKLMAGLIRPSRGQALQKGKPITSLPPEDRKIGIVFQSLALFPNLSVAKNVAFGPRQARRQASQIAATVDELLNLLQIAELRERMPRTLSGGQAQRVALARALALDTEILLLDEPFSSLDRTVADISCELIRAVHQRRGLTTILVTHDRHYALSLATRIVVLSPDGRMLDDGPPRTVYERPRTLAGARMTGRLVEVAGKVLQLENGKVRIATLGTEMAGTAGALPLRVGQQVIAAVRPERFEVVTGPADNAFHCRVGGPGPIDQPYDLICTTSDGTRFTAAVDRNGTRHSVGHELTLRVDPTDLHCFPAAEVA